MLEIYIEYTPNDSNGELILDGAAPIKAKMIVDKVKDDNWYIPVYWKVGTKNVLDCLKEEINNNPLLAEHIIFENYP